MTIRARIRASRSAGLNVASARSVSLSVSAAITPSSEAPLGEQQPDQPAIARVRLAAEQAGRLHPGRGPGHRGGGQPEAPGDLTRCQPVLGPQQAQDELLPLVDAVPGEGRRGRHRQVVLSRPERRLEVGRLDIGAQLVIGHRTSSVRPRNTLAGS